MRKMREESQQKKVEVSYVSTHLLEHNVLYICIHSRAENYSNGI